MPLNIYRPKTLWKTKSTACVFLRSRFAKQLLLKINISINQLFYAITVLALLVAMVGNIHDSNRLIYKVWRVEIGLTLSSFCGPKHTEFHTADHGLTVRALSHAIIVIPVNVNGIQRGFLGSGKELSWHWIFTSSCIANPQSRETVEIMCTFIWWCSSLELHIQNKGCLIQQICFGVGCRYTLMSLLVAINNKHNCKDP